MTAVRRAAASARQAPGIVRDGLSLLRHSRVLAGLVAVELFWSAGMMVFETFKPIRLSELLGGETAAAAVQGPVAAAGWGVFALGSALTGLASGRLGLARTAIVARVINGLGAVVMGLVAGPAALVAAYLFTYTMHGSAGPAHAALLHREASARNRSTVLSMNSMVAFLGFSLTALLGGLLAERAVDAGGDGGHRGVQPARGTVLPAGSAGGKAGGTAGTRHCSASDGLVDQGRGRHLLSRRRAWCLGRGLPHRASATDG